MQWKSQGRTAYMMQSLLSRGTDEMKISRDAPYNVGDYVRVRRTIRAPLQGQSGRIVEVCMRDERAPYLIQFSNGLQFRYLFEELQRIP